MSLNEEFDELARRKLEERAFPFQEADWQDARSRIDAQRRGGKSRAWIYGAGLILLLTGISWYAMRPATSESAHTAIAAQQVPHERSESALIASTKTNPTSSEAAPDRIETAHNTEKTQPVAVRITALKRKVSDPKKAVDPDPVKMNSAVPALSPRTSEHAVMQSNLERSQIPAPIANEGLAHAGANTVDPSSIGATEGALEQIDEGSIDALESENSSEPDPTPDPVGNTTSDLRAGAMVTTEAADVQEQRPDNKAIATPSGEEHVSANGILQEDHSSFALDQGPQENAIGSSATDQLGEQPPIAAIPSASDSSSIFNMATATPQDTATAITAAPEAAPPLVPVRAPWEITIIGGVFDTKVDYTGGNSADWTGSISGERSFGIGAEIMHMGRNIGMGSGLFYGSYAERIRTDAIDVSTNLLTNYWYLMAVDTTILFITDTIQSGGPYSGVSIDTTVNVLTQGTDTTTITEHLRDARDQVNHVSYFEVPLLLDGHVTQGRWMLGLRGGPTIGMLTGRRGSLPNATNDGYLHLADQAFREVIFGYTARAYIRYRFNAGWSVGVEPTIRGQLFNSLGSGDIQRLASARGVVLSLTYRFR